MDQDALPQKEQNYAKIYGSSYVHRGNRELRAESKRDLKVKASCEEARVKRMRRAAYAAKTTAKTTANADATRMQQV